MRKIISLFNICLPSVSIPQPRIIRVKNGTDTLYTATGFEIYVGQKLKIGPGAMPDGNFKYIRKSNTRLFAYGSTTRRKKVNFLKRNKSGLEYKVIRIDERGNKKHGFVYYPILASRYEVDIDNAIAAGEIVVPDQFKPMQKVVLINIQEDVSIAINS